MIVYPLPVWEFVILPFDATYFLNLWQQVLFEEQSKDTIIDRFRHFQEENVKGVFQL